MEVKEESDTKHQAPSSKYQINSNDQISNKREKNGMSETREQGYLTIEEAIRQIQEAIDERAGQDEAATGQNQQDTAA